MIVLRVLVKGVLLVMLCSTAAQATPPEIDPLAQAVGVLPKLAKPARPLPGVAQWVSLPGIVGAELSGLRQAMRQEVPDIIRPNPHEIANAAARATILLTGAGQPIEAPQLLLVVDRNPAR